MQHVELLSKGKISDAAEFIIKLIEKQSNMHFFSDKQLVYFENVIKNIRAEINKKHELFISRLDSIDTFQLAEIAEAPEIIELREMSEKMRTENINSAYNNPEINKLYSATRLKFENRIEELRQKAKENFEKEWLKIENQEYKYLLAEIPGIIEKNTIKKRDVDITKVKIDIIEKSKIYDKIFFQNEYPSENFNEWIIVTPELTERYSLTHYDEITYGDFREIENNLRKHIEISPKAELSAYLQLGLILKNTDRKIEGYSLIEKSFRLGIDNLPESFNKHTDKIPYGLVENRAFLRSCVNYGKVLFEQKFYRDALDVFEFVINVTSDSDTFDRMNVLPDIINSYLALKIPEYVIELDEWKVKYLYDENYYYLYGLFLAHFQLENYKEANKILKIAKKEFPRIRTELIKKRHLKPKDYYQFVSIYGVEYVPPKNSFVQAYIYWEETKELWKNTKNVIEYLKNN